MYPQKSDTHKWANNAEMSSHLHLPPSIIRTQQPCVNMLTHFENEYVLAAAEGPENWNNFQFPLTTTGQNMHVGLWNAQ